MIHSKIRWCGFLVLCLLTCYSFLVTVALAKVPGSNLFPFFGKVAIEASMEFDHGIEFRFEVSKENANARILLKAAARAAIEEQLRYLFGPMYAEKIHKSAPKRDHSVEPISIVQKDGEPDTYFAKYHYSGMIVTTNTGDKEFSLQLPLPTDPVALFESSIVEKASGEAKYPCFSLDAGPADYDIKYFWYFWDPALKGCLLLNGKHYKLAKAHVTVGRNTVTTYPQYPDLVHDGVLSTTIFVGMDDPSHSRDPKQSQDDAAQSFKVYERWLESHGFDEIPHEKLLYRKYLRKNGVKIPDEKLFTVKEFTKKVNGIRLWTRLVFSPTGMMEESAIFWHLFRNAIEDHSIMIYDGHSGLGVDLSISGLNIHGDYILKPDPKRYQIYHFDACDSYSYYNNKYIVLKGGTKKLDIVTNGLITDMALDDSQKTAIINAVHDWASGAKAWSFQEIAKKLDSGNLLGINGDEDNPSAPPAFVKN